MQIIFDQESQNTNLTALCPDLHAVAVRFPVEPNLRCFDTVFRKPYRCFSIVLKVILSLSDRYKLFINDWPWTEVCQNVVFSKIDITLPTINKKLWNPQNPNFARSRPATENPTTGTNVCKKRAKSKFRGHSQKIIFAHILSIDRHKWVTKRGEVYFWIWRKSTKSIFVVRDLRTSKIWGKMRRSQNFARTHTGRKRGKISKFVKYFPMNQFIKGSTSGLVMKKLEETWGVKITLNRTWPFFSAVTLLHPLPFKNSI